MKPRRCGTSRRAWRRSINSIGKPVFITGCSSGIGRSCALLFAQQGYSVTATARDLESIRELELAGEPLAGEIRITRCDVSSEESMREAVQFARECFGPVQILVNNAGFGLFGPIEMLSMDDVRRQLEINTLGPMRLVQLVVPDMRDAGWGRIINVSSVAGRMTIPFGGWYSASKHAMEALADALRLELRSFGIETVSILPGPVDTKFTQNVQTPVKSQADAPEVYRKIGQAMRTRQAGKRRFTISAEDVAAVIVKASRKTRPKTRYFVTAQGWAGIMLKRFLTDRAWDRMMASYYEIDKFIKP
jgi:NAD(P)-dependent dehydrogenase (short-subunit alcohol dehydrogenase family)